MQITVHLLAFNEDRPAPVRLVTVPDDAADNGVDNLLGVVFYEGQNEFQPQPCRSVSVGDVIELPDGALVRVRGVGFEFLPEGTDLASLERGVRACLLP